VKPGPQPTPFDPIPGQEEDTIEEESEKEDETPLRVKPVSSSATLSANVSARRFQRTGSHHSKRRNRCGRNMKVEISISPNHLFQ
jgi:hypothetical protein